MVKESNQSFRFVLDKSKSYYAAAAAVPPRVVFNKEFLCVLVLPVQAANWVWLCFDIFWHERPHPMSWRSREALRSSQRSRRKG